MEVSTVPRRWKHLKDKPEDRNERAKRTNVTRLDYLKSGEVKQEDCKTSKDLHNALNEKSYGQNGDDIQLRLFIVEDLSRDVIELLGTHLDIQPAFFREHIVDYAWYNVRDPWVDPPNLDIVARKQRWLQLRFVTARYFDKAESFEKASEEAELFNVLRRPDSDESNKTRWDKQGAVVGITRTRASFWLKPAEVGKRHIVGEYSPKVNSLTR